VTESGRIPSIRSVADYVALYPGRPDEARVAEQVVASFDPDAAWGQALHNPGQARRMLELSRYVFEEMGSLARPGLRELAVQMVNKRLQCEYGFLRGLERGREAGVSEVKLASLDFPESEVYDDEERFVLRLARATLECDVSDDLFDEGRRRYGEKGMLELGAVICYAAYEAIVLNILRPRATG
jgi:alkylhydroperoxidase family enzyme